MGHEYMPHHVSGRTSSGSPPVGGVPSGGWIAGSVPDNSRNSPASLTRSWRGGHAQGFATAEYSGPTNIA